MKASNGTALPPVQSLWIGRPLSNVEKLCIKSFLANGHPFHLYIYQPIEGVPEGTTLCDAREILPEGEIFTNPAGWGKGGLAPFADWFRLELLQKMGGWWVDMDMVCLKPLDEPRLNLVASSDERNWGIQANTNVLRFEPNNPFIKACIDRFKEKRAQEVTHALGPLVMQETIKAEGRQDLLAEFWRFNPICWRHVRYIVNPQEPIWHPRRIKRELGITEKVASVKPGSLMLHLWNEIWTQSGFDRNGTYHPRSLFEQVKARYMKGDSPP